MHALVTNFSDSRHFTHTYGSLILSEQILSPALFHAQLVNRSCTSFPSSQSNHSLKSPSSMAIARGSQTTSEMARLARRVLLLKKKCNAAMQSNTRCDPAPTKHSTVHGFRKKQSFPERLDQSGTLLPSRGSAEAPAAPTDAVRTLYRRDGSPRRKASFPCYLLLQNILNDKF